MAREEEFEDWSEFPDDEDALQDPAVTKAEDEADDALALLRKQQKAQKHVDKEEREALGSIVTEFLKNASPEQIELADIFLDGVTTSTQAKKAIDKITARAAKLNPEDHIADPASESEEEHEDRSFSPPIEGSSGTPLSDGEKMTKKLKSGGVSIGDFMKTWESTPPGQFSYNE
jgi:hypothetical protein